MKTATLFFGLVATTSANIIFKHVELSCNSTNPHMYHGCLRGQDCNEGGLCVPQDVIRYSYNGLVPNLQPRDSQAYSTDGTCGPAHGNTICDPNSKVYSGGCCSQYGWCGSTNAYCGSGCISGCSAAVAPPAGVAPRPDGLCGANYGGATCDPNGLYGGCCSKYGYCGSTPDHCLASNGCQSGCPGGSPPSTTTAGEPVFSITPGSGGNGVVTTDGTCGASNGNTVCGNWNKGSCCSMYGFCGSTDGHCGAGCQSGPCLSAPVVAAPGPSPAPPAPSQGYFTIAGQSGVPAMHAGLMPNGRVFFLDKLEDYSQLRTKDGYYAMSSEYDPNTNTVVPLAYKTNAFCSGGTFLADGSVVSLGGNGPLDWLNPNIKDGFNAIRRLSRLAWDDSANGADWVESDNNKLASARWYASAQTMPDRSIFVASGSLNGLNPTVISNNNPTYEILNFDSSARGIITPMAILEQNMPYYMYPFIHLLKDGSLFIFVAKSSQIFAVNSNTVVKELPDLPGDFRTYPNTGGSVLLPLTSANGWEPDIVICGGGAYQDITSPCDPSCGRIQPLSPNANWEMESMPEARGQVEGVLLPDGTVVWLNGGSRGAQGFGLMSGPTLEALLYDPNQPRGQRFSKLAASSIPRLYHSVACLLLDGTILIAGSNPVEMPKLVPDDKDPYVTEFRVERYTPPYLQGENVNRRPTNIVFAERVINADGSQFILTFQCPQNAQSVKVVFYHGGYVTHSVHMGHRMIQLDFTGWAPGGTSQTLFVTTPPNNNVAPPGPYVVYVLVDGVPGLGQFVLVN